MTMNSDSVGTSVLLSFNMFSPYKGLRLVPEISGSHNYDSLYEWMKGLSCEAKWLVKGPVIRGL